MKTPLIGKNARLAWAYLTTHSQPKSLKAGLYYCTQMEGDISKCEIHSQKRLRTEEGLRQPQESVGMTRGCSATVGDTALLKIYALYSMHICFSSVVSRDSLLSHHYYYMYMYICYVCITSPCIIIFSWSMGFRNEIKWPKLTWSVLIAFWKYIVTSHWIQFRCVGATHSIGKSNIILEAINNKPHNHSTTVTSKSKPGLWINRNF